MDGIATPVATTSAAAASSRGDLGAVAASSSAAAASSRGDLGADAASRCSRAGPGPGLYRLEREPQWSFEECRGGQSHADIA